MIWNFSISFLSWHINITKRKYIYSKICYAKLWSAFIISIILRKFVKGKLRQPSYQNSNLMEKSGCHSIKQWIWIQTEKFYFIKSVQIVVVNWGSFFLVQRLYHTVFQRATYVYFTKFVFIKKKGSICNIFYTMYYLFI